MEQRENLDVSFPPSRIAFALTERTRCFHPIPAWEKFIADWRNEASAASVAVNFTPCIAVSALAELVRDHGSDYGLVWVNPGDQPVFDDAVEDAAFLFPQFVEGQKGEALGHGNVGIEHAFGGDETVAKLGDVGEGLVEHLGE
jgi:hypothetical protein